LNLIEKILAAKSGCETVSPGQIVRPKLDMVFGNELGTSLAIKGREKYLRNGVFDPEKIAIIPDHFTPNRDVVAANQCRDIREFVKKYGIKNYFEVGRLGIEHIILHEKGLVVPGDIVLGADSHTCTYGALGAFATGVGSTDMLTAMVLGELWLRVPESIKVVLKGKLKKNVTGKDIILHLIGILGLDGARYKALEFAGDISSVSLDSRFTVCNMAIEAGAKAAIFPVDDVVLDYIKDRAVKPWTVFEPDADAVYERVITIDLDKLDVQLACPDSPANVKPASEVAPEKLHIDQAFIGSCTNGRLEDMRLAAEILRGRKVSENTRLLIIPGSQEVYAEALKAGYINDFIEAGAAVCTPTCGPCIGGHMGVLAGGERCVATTNRNFKGRMGDQESELYLSGVPVAAASAVCGYIALPEEVV